MQKEKDHMEKKLPREYLGSTDKFSERISMLELATAQTKPTFSATEIAFLPL